MDPVNIMVARAGVCQSSKLGRIILKRNKTRMNGGLAAENGMLRAKYHGYGSSTMKRDSDGSGACLLSVILVKTDMTVTVLVLACSLSVILGYTRKEAYSYPYLRTMLRT